MRIATSQYQSSMLESLQLNQERMNHLTQQMASGQRIMLPSDDPVDSVRLSRLNREQAEVTQYIANIDAVKTRLLKDESYLGTTVNDMQQGRDLLVWASDGSNAPADLAAMVTPLTALRESLFYTANTRDHEGRSVFAGTRTDLPAISYDASAAPGARYSYTGNSGEQNVIVGNGITQVANTNLDGMEKLLNRMDATIAALSAPGVSSSDPAVMTTLTANLDAFDDALNLVSGKVAVLGGTQTILSALATNHGNLSLSNQMAQTDIGQLDIGLAVTDLNGYTTALQATYKSYAKISGLSLFEVL